MTTREAILADLETLAGVDLVDSEVWVELPAHALTPLRVWCDSPSVYDAAIQRLARFGFISTDEAKHSSSHVLLGEENVFVVALSHTVKLINGAIPALDQRLIVEPAARSAAGEVLRFWEHLIRTPAVSDETHESVIRTWDTMAVHNRASLLAGLPRVTRTLVEAATSMDNPRLLLKAHKALRRSVRAARFRSLAERGVLRTHVMNAFSPISSTAVVFLAGTDEEPAALTAALLTTHQMTARPVRLSRNPVLAAARYLFVALPYRLSGVSTVCYDPPSVRLFIPRPLVAATPARPIVGESDAALSRTSRLASSEALWLKTHAGSRRVVDASPLSIACSTLQGTYSRFPESWFSISAK